MTPPSPLRFAILASLGILGGCPSQATGPGPDAGPGPSPDMDPVLAQAEGLAAEKDWQRCMRTWESAAQAAFGDDAYPFDQEGKQELLEGLEDSEGEVRSLQRRGLLSEAEAGLLLQDIATLRSGVHAKRTNDMMAVTCYEPMMYTPRRDALESLGPRGALLEGLAAQEVLQPEVVSRVLEQVRSDLAKLTGPSGEGLRPDEQAQADEVERRVGAALATIEQRLRSPHDSPDPSEPGPEGGDPIIPEAAGGE